MATAMSLIGICSRPTHSPPPMRIICFTSKTMSWQKVFTFLLFKSWIPTHASDQKPWVMNDPGERAQQIWASALYLKTNYGINISYGVIYNEPNMSYTILADDIKALGPRFITNGLATLVQYAEAVAPQTDWSYITPVQNDADMWPSVGRISYHNYGTADPYRSFLRDYASAKGLTTAQTEMGNPTFDDLFNRSDPGRRFILGSGL